MIGSAFFEDLNATFMSKFPSLEAKSKILKLHLRNKRHIVEPSDIRELVVCMHIYIMTARNESKYQEATLQGRDNKVRARETPRYRK